MKSSSSVSTATSNSSMDTLLKYKASLCAYAPEILIKTIIYASIFTILLCFLDVKTLIMLIAICFIFVICTFTIIGRSVCSGLEEDELLDEYSDEFSNYGDDEHDNKKQRKQKKYKKYVKKNTTSNRSSSTDTDCSDYSTDDEILDDVEMKQPAEETPIKVE